MSDVAFSTVEAGHLHREGRQRGERPAGEAGERAGGQAADGALHPRRAERAGRLQLRRRRARFSPRTATRCCRSTIAAARAGAASSRRRSTPTGATSKWWICSAASTALIKAGVADPDRLGICGWSYGGILTDYTIATDTRFKAAISRRRQRAAAHDVRRRPVHRAVRGGAGQPWKHQDLWMKVSLPVLPRGPDQDADAVHGRRQGLQRAARRRRADVSGAAEQRRREPAGDLPGPAPRDHDAELPARSAASAGSGGSTRT